MLHPLPRNGIVVVIDERLHEELVAKDAARNDLSGRLDLPSPDRCGRHRDRDERWRRIRAQSLLLILQLLRRDPLPSGEPN